MQEAQTLNIIGLLVEDHDRISDLLKDFKKQKHLPSKKTNELFKKLKQSLLVHLHQEEILYSRYKYKTGKILPILQTIRKEHDIILSKLDYLQNALKNGQVNINTADLYILLERHKNIEERLLYPEPGNILLDKEKEELYWKIKVR